MMIKKSLKVFAILSLLIFTANTYAIATVPTGISHSKIITKEHKKTVSSWMWAVPPVIIAVGIIGTVLLRSRNTTDETSSRIVYNGFTPKESNWIQLLCGDKAISEYGFRYNSCKAFRDDSDDNLEKFHDFIQIMFPAIKQSKFANKDLYIEKKPDAWKNFLRQNPEIYKNIRANMIANFISMLKFWKFDLSVDSKSSKLTSITAHPEKQDFNNHNASRVTRVLESLKLFGLNDEHKMFLDALNKGYSGHKSLSFWNMTSSVCSLI